MREAGASEGSCDKYTGGLSVEMDLLRLRIAPRWLRLRIAVLPVASVDCIMYDEKWSYCCSAP